MPALSWKQCGGYNSHRAGLTLWQKVGISDESQVRQARVRAGSRHGEMPMEVIGWDR
jgi:hypothetical protein